MESPAKFTETSSAAGLLEEFYFLSGKPGRRYARSTNEAAKTFFGKDFLTIADFLAPIGEILIVPASPERDNTVQTFIKSSLHHTKKISGRTGGFVPKKKETIAEFFIRIGS